MSTKVSRCIIKSLHRSKFYNTLLTLVFILDHFFFDNVETYKNKEQNKIIQPNYFFIRNPFDVVDTRELIVARLLSVSSGPWRPDKLWERWQYSWWLCQGWLPVCWGFQWCVLYCYACLVVNIQPWRLTHMGQEK